MISLVVPTMWRYAPHQDFLLSVCELDVVKEIIIINNDLEKTPKHLLLDHQKVKNVSFGKNIYVNPAWNAGVRLSKSEIVGILNDDLLFDTRLFQKVYDFFDDKVAAIGLCNGVVEYGQTPVTNGLIDFETFTGQACYGWGNLMFLRRSCWRDIPDDLQMFFGDNFIFDHYHFNWGKNYFITNLAHFHQGAVTTLEIRQERPFYEQEEIKYKNILQEIRDTCLIKN